MHVAFGAAAWGRPCGPEVSPRRAVTWEPTSMTICPKPRTADTTQPAAAALAASVAAYEPELVDRVFTNASWIAAAWALTA